MLLNVLWDGVTAVHNTWCVRACVGVVRCLAVQRATNERAAAGEHAGEFWCRVTRSERDVAHQSLLHLSHLIQHQQPPRPAPALPQLTDRIIIVIASSLNESCIQTTIATCLYHVQVLLCSLLHFDALLLLGSTKRYIFTPR